MTKEIKILRLENRIANTFYMFLVVLGVFGGALGSIF